MNILGYNSGYARPGYGDDPNRHVLNDGSAACLIGKELLFAAIEERYSGKRYQGGINSLMERAISVYPDLPPPDVVSFSTCCGPIWSENDATNQVFTDVIHRNPKWSKHAPQVLVVDHHDSHAMSTFVPSGFDRAIVVVYDGIGNLLNSEGWNKDCWWRGSFERQTYYLAEWRKNKVNLNVIGREATGINDVGLGEAYRSITHYGGWTSYQHAGTVMALSAFAEIDQNIYLDIIQYLPEGIHVAMKNKHPEPDQMITDLLRPLNMDCRIPPGRTASPKNKEYCKVVSLMQTQLENTIVQQIKELSSKYNIKNIAMSGGVSLNCLAMGNLASNFEGKIYVAPAPGDTGQGLGNALWASFCEASPVSGKISRNINMPLPPFWGITIPQTEIDQVIRKAQKDAGLCVIEHLSSIEQAQTAAQAIAEGNLVATVLGRSEYGPRALGARSILADPRKADTPQRVNRFKRREPFRPFAPSVLSEYCHDFFCYSTNSDYMSFAAPVREAKKGIIPAVVHADGTARYQSVSGGPMRPILEAFLNLTDVPILLNTSFNRKGQPMIETPMEAFDTFQDSSLDMLLLNNFTIRRKEM